MNWFDGAPAVVTGAAHGIGRGTAELLAELGARVLAVDIDEQALAVAMLVRELAQEFAPYGIRVNAVSPGVVRSAHVPAPDEHERERLQRLVPLGGIG
jgi:NAD(P)-dependent dehydrogenase (short-subunit alcohol dehydrogenase family)